MNAKIDKKRIVVNGVGVMCHISGEGDDTIVLLHGAGVDSAMLSWTEVIPLLSAKYKVIAPDLPGYGESDRIDGEYSLEFYTNIVKEIIENFGSKPVILTGLSLGGGISLNMALAHPELIKVLVPVDAWGLFEKLPFHLLTYWFIKSKINDNLYKMTNKYPSIIRWSLASNLFGDKTLVSDKLVNEILAEMKKPGVRKPFISFQRSEIRPFGFTTDLFGRLSEIKCPTFLVHGSLDKAVPVKGALLASQKIPNCELFLMKGCKHWPQKERPEEFARALISYLERVCV